MKQKVLKLTLNNSSLIELSGHSGDGMPFRIIRDAEYKKEPAKRIFSYVQQYRQSLEKTEKNNTDLLDILDKLML